MARAPATPAPNGATRLSALPPEVVDELAGPEVVGEEEDPSVAVEGGTVMAMVVSTTAPSLAVTEITVSVAVSVSVATSGELVLVLTARIWPKVGSWTLPSTCHQPPAVDVGQARVDILLGL